jgi:hypothetical protein
MNTWTESSKLLQLRAKTDRQLVEMLTRKLEVARCFARTEEYRGRAERACEEVRRLLPLVDGAERRGFAARLDEICATLHPVAHAACF